MRLRSVYLDAATPDKLEAKMKFIKVACISCLLVACGAEKTKPRVVTPAVETANEVAETQSEPAVVDPDADALADTEWAPDDTLPEDGDRAVELGIEGAYGDVVVDGYTRPKPVDPSCNTRKDCDKMPKWKHRGEYRCVKKQCVFVRKKLDGDVIELF